MSYLLIGLLLWWVAHLFKRLAPARRAEMGEKGKAMTALGVGLGLVLMIIGYRVSAFVPVYDPPAWGRHANNLLVLIAFYMFAVAGAKTRLARHLRHPMLLGVVLWSVAHLLVNGDLSSIVLFGGLLLWALLEMIVISRAEPVWTPPAPGPMRKEITSVIATLVLYALVALVHTWLGYYPFG